MGFPMSLSMVADSVDYMEDRTGIRTDGTAYATYGLATKLGNAACLICLLWKLSDKDADAIRARLEKQHAEQ